MPVREAEEVLDQRRVRRLPARHVALEHDRRQPVGSRVDGGREAGRSGADDRKVVVSACSGWALSAHASASRSTVAPASSAVAVDQQRQLCAGRVVLAQRGVGLGRAGLQPRVRLRGAREEVAQAVVLRRQPAADDGDRRADGTHDGAMRNISSST